MTGQDPDTGKRLGKDCRKRRASYAHIEKEDKDRVEDDVGDRADQNRKHTGLGKALRRDEGVHSKGELNKDRADRVDAHICSSVVDRIFTRTKGKQQRTPE